MIKVRDYNDSKRAHLKYVVHIPPELQQAAGTKRKFFAKKSEADGYATWLTSEKARCNYGGRVMPDDLRVDSFRAFDILAEAGLGSGKLIDAVREYVTHQAKAETRVSFDDLAELYVASLKQDGKSHEHQRSAKQKLTKLGKLGFTGRWVHEITTPEISALLRAQEVSGVTRNGYRRYLHAAFEFARRELQCVEKNPVSDVRLAEVENKPVSLYTADEMTRLLWAARTLDRPEMVAYLALGAFAGLRPSEIEALTWERIKIDREATKDRVIDVDSSNYRLYSRRFVTILPVLEAWLRECRKDVGRVYAMATDHLERKLRAEVCEKAKVKWKQDALRHCFASYHYAHFRDLKGLLAEMGHRSPRMLEGHYRERVEPAEAAAWWEITPAATEKITSIAA